MMDKLIVGWSASFHKCGAALTDPLVQQLFADLRAAATSPSAQLIEEIRQPAGPSIYSATCFSYERAPHFLSTSAEAMDRIHGFVLLIEHKTFIAIIKSGLELPTSFKNKHLSRVDSGDIERAIATIDAKFEALNLKSMSTSRVTLKQKTLEADDLANNTQMSSASRFIPRRFRVRRKEGRFTATTNSGRISQLSERSNYEDALNWAASVVDALSDKTLEKSTFIDNFARQVSLSDLPAGTSPKNFALDIAGLLTKLEEKPNNIGLVKKLKPSAYSKIKPLEAYDALKAADKNYILSNIAGTSESSITETGGGKVLGRIKIGKSRISLRSFSHPSIENIYIHEIENGKEKYTSLKSYFDQQNLFIVLFDDISLAYVDGELVQDRAIRDGGLEFLRHLIPHSTLETAASEKGKFRTNQRKFSKNSVFATVVEEISREDDILLCDDLGDEWADFIGVSTRGTPPTICFYHAKHGKLSLSASAFHVSVGQAEKNLGRLQLPKIEIHNKLTMWQTETYKNESKVTNIKRIIRGGLVATIESKLDEIRTAPDTVRHIKIVTSSLSRAQVEAEFLSIKSGLKAPTAHFVQLYWLLTSYFSACTEMGAVGYVVCRP